MTNFIDKTISYFAPEIALKRQRARLISDRLTLAYDAAGNQRRVSSWKTGSTDATSEITPALINLRNRSRDLRRNNPIANRIIRVFANQIVGTGVLLSCEDAELLKVYNDWAWSTNCDFNNSLNFYALQHLILECLVENGEVLIRMRIVKSDGIPLSIEVLEPDFLALDKTDEKKNLINGIQFDSEGKPTTYYLYKNHPSGANSSSELIPVPADEIIHLFRKDRAGQVRGVPWLAPIMLKLKRFDDLISNQLERVALANLLTATIYNKDGDETANPTELELSPAAILELPYGKELVWNTPPDAGDTAHLQKTLLQQISTGVGMPYELLTNDYADFNFSSARMSINSFVLEVENIRWNVLIPALDRIVKWFFEASDLAGQYTYNPDEPPIYDFTPPKNILVDLVREIPVWIEAIKAGLITLSEAQRQFGFNPVELLTEYKADIDRLDSLGIKLSSDYRNDLVKATTTNSQNQKA